MSSTPTLISRRQVQTKLEDSASGPVVFIFGAGAAAGYTNTENPYFKAPVVRELFERGNITVDKILAGGEHATIARRLDYINDRVQRVFKGDLESYLSDLYVNNRDSDTTFADILRYLEDIFLLASRGITFDKNHYVSLFNHISEIRRGRAFSYITFNYDTILEKSYLFADRDVVRRATGFLTMANYYDTQPVILKMHGSINYRYVVEKVSHQSDQHNPNLSYSGIFNLMMGNTPTENVGATRDECTGLQDAKPSFKTTGARVNPRQANPNVTENFSVYNVPLMLIPVHEKISPENNFFLSMIERARKEIEAAHVIVAIGYNFADQAFMNALADLNFSGKSIILVTSHPLPQIEMNTHRAWTNIIASWKDARVEFFEGSGFGEFVDALIT
jgi:hypothetical protein